MTDPRVRALAHNLVHHATRLKPGDKILIESIGVPPALACALVDEVYAAGAHPVVWVKDPVVQRALMMGMTDEQVTLWADHEAHLMARVDAYVGIRGGENSFELSDVPMDKNALYAKRLWHPVHGAIRVPKTRWVVLRYPTPSMAQQAGMSTSAFEDYYFDVCCLDYGRMSIAMDALASRMARTDRVRIVGPGTDLRFSIKGLPVIKCDGQVNIPDGEVFTAPVRDSVYGTISFNTPSLREGFTYENVVLTFEAGKIVDARANDSARLNAVLNTDEGARYVGEFAIGVNPYITRPMKDTLFDEKIMGSFHFTPGASYDECDNGNKSAIHWDMVCIQTPEFGGGEIYFDDELIRRDGRFVPADLDCLNPENLK
ncbi:MAG: aminopeptidase [Clostridiales bacterium]|nr:aminopeptidase [Clostridiales bacterium]